MIERSLIEKVLDELKQERKDLLVNKKYDFQAIGFRKAIDKIHEVLNQEQEKNGN